MSNLDLGEMMGLPPLYSSNVYVQCIRPMHTSNSVSFNWPIESPIEWFGCELILGFCHQVPMSFLTSRCFILQSRLLIWSHLILCFWLGEIIHLLELFSGSCICCQLSKQFQHCHLCAIALSSWPSALPSGNFVYSHHHPCAFSDSLYSTFYNLRSALRALWIWVHEDFILERFLNSALLCSDISSLNFGAYCGPDLFYLLVKFMVPQDLPLVKEFRSDQHCFSRTWISFVRRI